MTKKSEKLKAAVSKSKKAVVNSLLELYTKQFEANQFEEQKFAIVDIKPVTGQEGRSYLTLKDVKTGELFNEFIFNNSGLYTAAEAMRANCRVEGSLRECPIVTISYRKNSVGKGTERKVYTNAAYLHDTGERLVVKWTQRGTTNSEAKAVAEQAVQKLKQGSSSSEDTSDEMFG